MYDYFTRNNLITKNQSGFCSGDSTTNQLINLVNEIHSSLDNRLEVRAVFLDIAKAFDKVWHDGLIFKLRQNGISNSLIKLLENYLSNRKQRVVLNGNSSAFFPIESGVPQGSVLGPLLFLIYINDLENDILSKIKFFADDTMLYSIVTNPLQTSLDLNRDLDTINKWAYQWKMAFNPEPSKQAIELLFSQKKKAIQHPPLYFNGFEIARSSEHKHLGLILDSKLTFSSHVYEKIQKAQKSIGVLKFLSSYLPLKTLDQIYKLFTRSQFDYCDVIYHTPASLNLFDSSFCLSPLMEKIEHIQYHAARVITGTWKGTSMNKLYDELGWESMSDRRWSRRLIHFFKIHIDLTPSYLRDTLPPKRRMLYGRPNPNIYQNVLCKTEKYKNSFFPDTVKSWNNLDVAFQQSISLTNFKKKLYNLVRPPPKPIFGLHFPKGIRYIFQLRLGLSPLFVHKIKYNFSDTPSDVCSCAQESETLSHFLFKCSLYQRQRNILLNDVSLILGPNFLHELNNPKMYLYGLDALDTAANKAILKATIDYIIETNRF